ncbi:hypothetical protein KSF81_18850 [Siccirubricoccus sp. G192]|nr:hypothetical protein [Siccirubricoccus sp. G192]
MLRVQAGLPLTHVPYSGSGPAWADLPGGRVDMVLDNIQAALPHQQAGRVRILAVSGQDRLALLPDTPTLWERLPGYLVHSWNGIAGLAGLPPEIAARLSGLIATAMRGATLRARYAELGMEIPAPSPAHFAGFIGEQLAFWQRVIAGTNIRLE